MYIKKSKPTFVEGLLLYFLIEKSAFFNNFFGELDKSRYLCGDNHSLDYGL